MNEQKQMISQWLKRLIRFPVMRMVFFFPINRNISRQFVAFICCQLLTPACTNVKRLNDFAAKLTYVLFIRPFVYVCSVHSSFGLCLFFSLFVSIYTNMRTNQAFHFLEAITVRGNILIAINCLKISISLMNSDLFLFSF